MPLIGKSEVQSSTFGDEVQLGLLTLDSSILQKYSHRLNLNPFPDTNIDPFAQFGHTEGHTSYHESLISSSPRIWKFLSLPFGHFHSTSNLYLKRNNSNHLLGCGILRQARRLALYLNQVTQSLYSSSEKIQIGRNWPSVILRYSEEGLSTKWEFRPMKI